MSTLVSSHNEAKVSLKVKSAKRRPQAKTTKKASPKIESPTSIIHQHFSASETKVRISEPLGHLMVEHTLRDAGFKGEISTNKDTLEKYATDESVFHIEPQIILKPEDVRDIEIAVQVVATETKNFPSLSLTPRASGTGLGGGSLTDSIVLDVKAHLHKVEEVKKSGGKVTIHCEAGAMWREVEKELKKLDYYLPSYPASKMLCTIGGAVANNSAGPDSLRYGHTADWVESMNVVLRDGQSYEVKPLSYKELRSLIKEKNALATIAKEVFTLIEKNETTIKRAKPKTAKNTAGYALWNVLNISVAEFKKGKGTFDLTRIFSGAQGTIGIITSVTMRAEPIAKHTSLIAVPVFDLSAASRVVLEALRYDPINIEVFDALTYDSAMKNPQFFKERLSKLDYYRVLLAMYTNFHVRWRRRLPEFVLLITLDLKNLKAGVKKDDIVKIIRGKGGQGARVVTNHYEKEMFWQVRDSSFSLSKLLDPKKRPAAFLEDMTVPPEHMAKFFSDIKYLLKKYNVTAAVHGHGGNGHFHFYPLLDFTSRSTPGMIMRMSEEFFNVAVKYGGNICGEHNDGIIRTPHMSKMFSKTVISLFETLEQICDPDDIFNPGKKVHPRFDLKSSIRYTN